MTGDVTGDVTGGVTGDVRSWTIAQFRAAYEAGASPADVVEAVLRLLTELPDALLIGLPLADRARSDAAALIGTDPRSLPLYGIPFVVKDNIDVAGHETTAGCPGFARVLHPTGVAPRDATLVERLRAAGAIVIGKTNLDQFATGLVGTRSPYGVPPNALRADLVPGGSSSGSAVAVALGAVPFSIGTDTAGSGRVPAALNGIVALKPTLGRFSSAGIVPAVRRLDCPSIFARCIADIEAVAPVIAGRDAADCYSRSPVPVRPLPWPPVIGVPDRWPTDVALDPWMRAQFDAAISRLRSLGASIVGIELPAALELGEMLYGSPLVAERSAAVGDAIALGVDGLDPTVTTIIGGSTDYSAVDAYRAEYRLAELRATCAAMWSQIDVLALPTTPTLVTRAAIDADPIGANRANGRLTTFANLADTACVVVPIEPGVPAGLQLLAPAWHDDELLRLGDGYVRGELLAPVHSPTIVVVGAHLEGLPLNAQLTERGAWLRERTTTAPTYRLFALPGTVPPKPGLQRVADGGAAIEVEVWSIGLTELGSFLTGVPSPLCIGTIELADGSWHQGFLCEPWALAGARDITDFGGWRAYVSGGPGSPR